MECWTSIIYREFYDVPLISLAKEQKRIFLFNSAFNLEKDEYDDSYDVYLMPPLDDKQLAGNWGDLAAIASSCLGRIPISRVRFDASRRGQVNLPVLSRFGF